MKVFLGKACKIYPVEFYHLIPQIFKNPPDNVIAA